MKNVQKEASSPARVAVAPHAAQVRTEGHIAVVDSRAQVPQPLRGEWGHRPRHANDTHPTTQEVRQRETPANQHNRQSNQEHRA